MTEKIVKAIVNAGKASAGPPLGPALGPLGVNIGSVIKEINEKTKELEGMEVPVKIIVNPATKEFKIEVGTPSVSALIKKELNLKKGSPKPNELRCGDLSLEQVKKIARMKFGSDSDSYVNQVIGTCKSMGVTIGKGPLTEEEIKKLREAEKKEEEKPEKAEEKKK